MIEKNKHFSSNMMYTVFALLFTLLSLLIFKSFLSGMIWSSIMTLSIWPLIVKLQEINCKIDQKYGQRIPFVSHNISDNALIYSLLFALLFILPVVYALMQINGFIDFIRITIQNNLLNTNFLPPDILHQFPYGEKLISLWKENISNSQALKDNIKMLVNKLPNQEIFIFLSSAWSQVIQGFMTLIVMIVSFYFFVKNGHIIQDNYQTVVKKIFGEKLVPHMNKGVEALQGTINGVILIGMIEGILLSIPLIIGGLHSAVIVALIAGILGVIPLVMPVLMIPFLMHLYSQGHEVVAILGAINLLFVWIFFENIIKPKVIGKKVKIHSLLILISMIGGMQLLGPLGLFIGPAIVSMSIGMIEDFIFKVE